MSTNTFYLQPITVRSDGEIMPTIHTSNGPAASLAWLHMDSLDSGTMEDILYRVGKLENVADCYWYNPNDEQNRLLIVTRNVSVWTREVANEICYEIAVVTRQSTDQISIEIGTGNLDNKLPR